MPTIEPGARALLEAPNFAHVATIREDGTILNVPVWVDVADDGSAVLLNSAQGRAWVNNLERTGQITLTVSNGANPYEYVSVTGHLDRAETDGADAHIDALAKKYLGADEYPYRTAEEQRVTLTIAPDRVKHHGAGE